jgi:carboxylesterase
MSPFRPTAEPFLFPGKQDKPGILFIHGFTSSPKELRGMGHSLMRQGYTALGVRLAGHATEPSDMIRSSWRDWAAAVEDGYWLLRGLTERVFVAGVSTGGALALLAATNLRVAGVIAMSTPYMLPTRWPGWSLKLLSRFRPYIRKSKGTPGAGWFDKQAFADHVAYPKNPVRSIAELQMLQAEMRGALPSVRVPVLLMHSQDDTYIPPGNMEQIQVRPINSPAVETMWISGSGHCVTRDAARETVYEAAAEFIRRHEGA